VSSSPASRPPNQAHALGHRLSRRAFFGSAGMGVAGLGLLQSPAIAEQLAKSQKRVIMLFLSGGMSQFESWDPKPGRPTGGPFQAIQTSVPGYHISELMPKMAAQLHRHTAVIRSVESKNVDHVDKTLYAGMKVVAGLNMPSIGSMLCRELANPELAVPHHVMFTASAYRGGHYTESPGFYGSQWGPINVLPDHIPPRPPFRHLGTSVLRLSPNSMGLPSGMTIRQHADREQMRDRLSQAFLEGRNRDAVLMGHSAGYSRVRGLMDCSHLYDIEKEPRKIRDAYGLTGFAQQTLLARRLVEAGVPFVRVNFGWWDTHGQNFEAHQEMVPELDHVMTTLLDDLATRGLLEHTLVVTFSEMGRTPKVNDNMGRDHFTRFSVSLSGCGIKPGVIYGETDADGQEISKDPVTLHELFATIFKAVGVDHQKEYHSPDGRPVPLTEYGTEPVAAVLA